MEQNTQDGRATMVKSTFHMENSVSIKIMAKPEVIWNLLTDVEQYTKWNSTIVSIAGSIAPNGKINLVSKLDPKRTFKLKISQFQPPEKLVWRDGFAPMFQGVRTFTLMPHDDGTTTFSMAEVLSGLILPMIKGSLPDFRPNFEQIAADLKGAAEAR